MNERERLTFLKGIFQSHCRNIIAEAPIFVLGRSQIIRNAWTISEEDIKFIDGSLLNFYEEINDETIERDAYEYIRPSGFFFLYENEGIDRGIIKPLHHLHVGIMKDYANNEMLELIPSELIEHKGPHFMAPEMDFHNFMGIIIANFFKEHEDYDTMSLAPKLFF